jgi:hypothetical protein
VIVSLLYKLPLTLLTVPTVLLRRDSSKDAELLVPHHEDTYCAARSPVQSATNLWGSETLLQALT